MTDRATVVPALALGVSAGTVLLGVAVSVGVTLAQVQQLFYRADLARDAIMQIDTDLDAVSVQVARNTQDIKRLAP
jgi:hypothetical protein